MGISDLKRAGTPLILHTRGNDGSRKYQHWIAFLGADGDKARILDAPHELETISFAELLANWDGLALAISTSPISDSLIDEARFDYIVSATAVVIAVYLFKRIRRTKTDLRVAISWQRRVAQSCGQIAVLVFVASAVGLIYHGTADIGFLNNPSAVAEVTRRYYSVDIPERSLAEVNASIENADAILVDARMSLDFRSGALPGAVSISVDSTLPERQRALGKISRSFPIIVYCQSSGCTYSDEVARFLKFNGYTRVSIYRGGFQEWQKQQHHPGDRAKTVEHEDVPEVGGNS